MLLSQFLQDIGAASLPPTVELPPTPSTKAPFAALQDRLEQEISNINDQTRQLLEQNWSDFQEQVADGKELLARMEEEDTELQELEIEIEAESFLPTLLTQLTTHSSLAQTHSLTNHSVTLFSSLLSLHSTISTLCNHTTSGSLPTAVHSLRTLLATLTRGAEPWIVESEAWSSLKKWATEEQVRLEGAIVGALEACFEFSSTTDDEATTSLVLRSWITAAPQGDRLEVPVLLQALEDVCVLAGGTKKVEGQMARIAKQLLKYFVAPFLEANGRPTTEGRLEIVFGEGVEEGVRTATLRPTTSALTDDPLATLASLLSFFSTNTFLFPPSPYAASFTTHLTPTIQNLIITSHLSPSLPLSHSSLSPYLTLLTSATTFESQLLPSLGYFSFLPSIDREEGRLIQTWIERVDRHWARKVGDGALEKVREEVRRSDWEGVESEVLVEVEGVPISVVTEQRMISVRSKAIVEIAEGVLVEALAVGNPSFPHQTFAPSSTPLLETFISILSLYRATAPVHHSNLLSSVPSIGVQFANDTEWIGDEVEKLWHVKGQGSSSPLKPKIEHALKMTKKMGNDWREQQITIQRDVLMESLDAANGFMYTSDDSRYVACERAVHQVTHTLERLVQVWKPVMNATALYSTLGSLINDVLSRVLEEIEDQQDISEEESIRLNKLCKLLHGLEDLFDNATTSIGREVAVWFKFVFLSELLEASMADILFLFNNGHLVDFEPDAIAKLVRALFADSPLRARNLEHILKGHPTVLPEDDDDDDDSFDDYSSRAETPPPPPTSTTLKREASPPTTPVRSGRQPLGTRIVGAKPIAPSPPRTPTPPLREPTPPLPSPSPPIVHRDLSPPQVDPELDASFDVTDEDAWGDMSTSLTPQEDQVGHKVDLELGQSFEVPITPEVEEGDVEEDGWGVGIEDGDEEKVEDVDLELGESFDVEADAPEEEDGWGFSGDAVADEAAEPSPPQAPAPTLLPIISPILPRTPLPIQATPPLAPEPHQGPVFSPALPVSPAPLINGTTHPAPQPPPFLGHSQQPHSFVTRAPPSDIIVAPIVERAISPEPEQEQEEPDSYPFPITAAVEEASSSLQPVAIDARARAESFGSSLGSEGAEDAWGLDVEGGDDDGEDEVPGVENEEVQIEPQEEVEVVRPLSPLIDEEAGWSLEEEIVEQSSPVPPEQLLPLEEPSSEVPTQHAPDTISVEAPSTVEVPEGIEDDSHLTDEPQPDLHAITQPSPPSPPIDEKAFATPPPPTSTARFVPTEPTHQRNVSAYRPDADPFEYDLPAGLSPVVPSSFDYAPTTTTTTTTTTQEGEAVEPPFQYELDPVQENLVEQEQVVDPNPQAEQVDVEASLPTEEELTTFEPEAEEGVDLYAPQDQPSYDPYAQRIVEDPYVPRQPVVDEPYTSQAAVEDPYSPQEAVEDPYAPQETVEDPYAPKEAVDDPYAPRAVVRDPYAPQEVASDPYAPQANAEDPYASQGAVEDPYAPQDTSSSALFLSQPVVDSTSTFFESQPQTNPVSFFDGQYDQPQSTATPGDAAFFDQPIQEATTVDQVVDEPLSTFEAPVEPPATEVVDGRDRATSLGSEEEGGWEFGDEDLEGGVSGDVEEEPPVEPQAVDEEAQLFEPTAAEESYPVETIAVDQVSVVDAPSQVEEAVEPADPEPTFDVEAAGPIFDEEDAAAPTFDEEASFDLEPSSEQPQVDLVDEESTFVPNGSASIDFNYEPTDYEPTPVAASFEEPTPAFGDDLDSAPVHDDGPAQLDFDDEAGAPYEEEAEYEPTSRVELPVEELEQPVESDAVGEPATVPHSAEPEDTFASQYAPSHAAVDFAPEPTPVSPPQVDSVQPHHNPLDVVYGHSQDESTLEPDHDEEALLDSETVHATPVVASGETFESAYAPAPHAAEDETEAKPSDISPVFAPASSTTFPASLEQELPAAAVEQAVVAQEIAEAEGDDEVEEDGWGVSADDNLVDVGVAGAIASASFDPLSLSAPPTFVEPPSFAAPTAPSSAPTAPVEEEDDSTFASQYAPTSDFTSPPPPVPTFAQPIEPVEEVEEVEEEAEEDGWNLSDGLEEDAEVEEEPTIQRAPSPVPAPAPVPAPVVSAPAPPPSAPYVPPPAPYVPPPIPISSPPRARYASPPPAPIPSPPRFFSPPPIFAPTEDEAEDEEAEDGWGIEDSIEAEEEEEEEEAPTSLLGSGSPVLVDGHAPASVLGSGSPLLVSPPTSHTAEPAPKVEEEEEEVAEDAWGLDETGADEDGWGLGGDEDEMV